MATNLVVHVFRNDVEGALKRLKKLSSITGLTRELRKRESYMKPGEVRRMKSKVARAKARKATKRRVLHADAA